MMDADAVFTVGNLSPVTEEVIDRHHPVIPEVITRLFHIRACSTGTGEVIQLIYTATEYLTRFAGLSINIRNTNQLDMTAFLVIQLTGTFSQDSADIDSAVQLLHVRERRSACWPLPAIDLSNNNIRPSRGRLRLNDKYTKQSRHRYGQYPS